MCRRIARGLAIVLSVVSLGAAQKPTSSESATNRSNLTQASKEARYKARKAKPYQIGTASANLLNSPLMRGQLINDRVIDDRLIHDRQINDARQHLIVALDVSSAAAARTIVAAVGESARTYKVGMQLFTAEGPQIVRELVASGRSIFLDLKYHDIPTTVASSVREAAKLDVSMLTVHASGGSKMLRAAVEVARSINPELMVLGVTVLTSMDEADLEEAGT